MNNAIGVSDDRHKSNQDPPCIITPGFLPRAPFLWACIGDVHRGPQIDSLIFFILKMKKLRFTEME